MPTLLPTILLLDFDGVVNADRPAWPDPDKHAQIEADGVTYPVRWSPRMMSELVNLYYLDLLDIRWCSTWAPHAAKVNATLDLPAFPGCWDTEPVNVPAAKLAAAQAVLAEGRRLIWADDDHLVIPNGKQRRALGMTGDTLYLRPNAYKGLSQSEVDRIRNFATRVARQARV